MEIVSKYLPAGTYEYKYVVDGTWVAREDKPRETESGFGNNTVTVKPYKVRPMCHHKMACYSKNCPFRHPPGWNPQRPKAQTPKVEGGGGTKGKRRGGASTQSKPNRKAGPTPTSDSGRKGRGRGKNQRRPKHRDTRQNLNRTTPTCSAPVTPSATPSATPCASPSASRTHTPSTSTPSTSRAGRGTPRSRRGERGEGSGKVSSRGAGTRLVIPESLWSYKPPMHNGKAVERSKVPPCRSELHCKDPNCPYTHPDDGQDAVEVPPEVHDLGLDETDTRSVIRNLRTVEGVCKVSMKVEVIVSVDGVEKRNGIRFLNYTEDLAQAVADQVEYEFPELESLEIISQASRRLINAYVSPLEFPLIHDRVFSLAEANKVARLDCNVELKSFRFSLFVRPRVTRSEGVYLLYKGATNMTALVKGARAAVSDFPGLHAERVEVSPVHDAGTSVCRAYKVLRVSERDDMLHPLVEAGEIATADGSTSFAVVAERRPVFFSSLVTIPDVATAEERVRAYIQDALPPWEVFQSREMVQGVGFDTTGQYGFAYVSLQVVRDILHSRDREGDMDLVQKHGIVFDKFVSSHTVLSGIKPELVPGMGGEGGVRNLDQVCHSIKTQLRRQHYHDLYGVVYDGERFIAHASQVKRCDKASLNTSQAHTRSSPFRLRWNDGEVRFKVKETPLVVPAPKKKTSATERGCTTPQKKVLSLGPIEDVTSSGEVISHLKEERVVVLTLGEGDCESLTTLRTDMSGQYPLPVAWVHCSALSPSLAHSAPMQTHTQRLGSSSPTPIGLTTKSAPVGRTPLEKEHELLGGDVELTSVSCLLGQAQRDPQLSTYGVVVVEVSSKSLYTDMVLAVLRDTLGRREDLQVLTVCSGVEPRPLLEFFAGYVGTTPPRAVSLSLSGLDSTAPRESSPSVSDRQTDRPTTETPAPRLSESVLLMSQMGVDPLSLPIPCLSTSSVRLSSTVSMLKSRGCLSDSGITPTGSVVLESSLSVPMAQLVSLVEPHGEKVLACEIGAIVCHRGSIFKKRERQVPSRIESTLSSDLFYHCQV
ncbi:hypothetical protein KIPB_002045 [Kipferlia bialata]|uniref:AMP-activated protein kinase glycogen-binding domain-containing protein n=1 Tax=Kipferlia bialata TaxID=797122 RepID=A0A9K3CPU0_9EUKA|nr:hypothetical protein KIPB_002045 [Kipferlia bialata]|eukprot:g2045.t1